MAQRVAAAAVRLYCLAPPQLHVPHAVHSLRHNTAAGQMHPLFPLLPTPAGTMTFAVTHMVLAGVHYRKAGGNVQQAARGLASELQALHMPVPANCETYVRTWGPRLRDDGSIEGHAQLSGRRPGLSAEEVATCHAEATGWFAAGRSGPYGSMDDLIANSPKVQEIIAEANVTPQTLSRQIKKHYPNFKYGNVGTKDLLTPDHCSERVAACQRNLRMTQRSLHLVVWVDSKSMILVIKGRRGWMDTSVCDYEGRRRPPQVGSKIINLKYYIAVNALLGPVWLAFTTGTPGVTTTRSGRTYLVSSRHKQKGAAPSMHVRCRRTELVSPTLSAHALMLVAVWVQPQHTETAGERRGGQLVVFLCPCTQAAVTVVCACVVLACVLLPMHFHQQVGWHQRQCIPFVPVQVQRAAVAD